MKKKLNNLSEANTLRKRAEAHLKNNPLRINAISSESEILKLSHELAVHQIELEIQNLELSNIQEELVIQNIEKEKRAQALIAANRELLFQNEEKEIRAEELIIANKELEEALQINSDKNRFISILAHDLRNPFTVLLGYSELLLEKIPHLSISEIEKLVREIKETTKDTFDLLEDLLKWARFQSGKVPFKPQKIRFASAYLEILKSLIPVASEKNITIINSVPNEIEVFADVDMLKAVFRNLLTNAIKFTSINGQVKVAAEQTDTYTQFSISDTGIGIESQYLAKLFDLGQLHPTTGTNGEKGTGLGLFLCKGFVEKQGGKIWAESDIGKGSVFHFNIPINPKRVEKKILSSSDEVQGINNLKILIADDNEAIRMILGEMVKKYSSDIQFAKSGEEAITICQKDPDLDLILMDFYMPGMNGYEATQKIRQINKEVVIIVETADTLSNVTEEFAGVKINDYFPKPFNKVYLNQLIEKHFSKKKPLG